jgi:uncharacterized FlgJ-related protein
MIEKASATSVFADKVIPAIPERTEKVHYERKFIESQIVAITAQRDELIRLKEAELKECVDILKEMDKLGIVAEEPKVEDVNGKVI